MCGDLPTYDCLKLGPRTGVVWMDPPDFRACFRDRFETDLTSTWPDLIPTKPVSIRDRSVSSRSRETRAMGWG